jgi:hypothetical protein
VLGGCTQPVPAQDRVDRADCSSRRALPSAELWVHAQTRRVARVTAGRLIGWRSAREGEA